MASLTLFLDTFILKRKAEALQQLALASGQIPSLLNFIAPSANVPANNTQFYVQVFPHTRDDEEPSTIGVGQLGAIASLASSALSAVSAVAGALGAGEGSPSDKLSAASVACQISKAINEVGSWSITAKNTENWHKHFRAGDWVVIFMGNDIYGAPDASIRVIGQIDRIQKNTATARNGAKITTWSFVGRDFGRCFEDTNIYLSRYQATASDFEILMTKLIPSDAIKDPSTYVKQYLKLAFDNSAKSVTKLEVPSDLTQLLGKFGKSLFQMIDQDIHNVIGHCAVKSLPDNSHITLLDMIQAATNSPWNEFIFETVDGQPTFTFQPCIFTENQLKDIGRSTAIPIKSEYIVDRNLGISDHERINFIEIHGTTNSDQDLEHAVVAAKSIPAIPRSIQKYGLKKYEVTTEFAQPLLALSPFDKKNNVDNTVYNDLRDVLTEYMFNKHKLVTGSVTLLTDNFVPLLGRWVKLDDMVLKVEGMDMSWEFGESMNIELALTHGMAATGSSPYVETALAAPTAGPTLANTDDTDPILMTKEMKSPKSQSVGADVAASIATQISNLIG